MAQLLQKVRRASCLSPTKKTNILSFIPLDGSCSLFITFLLHLSQEVVVEGQDKVFKDVIEPLENVSVTVIPTAKENIRDFGPPNEVAETLIKKVLAPPSQKTKLIAASEVSFSISSLF
ncbi:hypothetical protein Leryth_004587 [Lithospermum erythrorhizon]|nr:hypothetical protein Leryth_004587 [Lithospermum erythrorhizon]